MHEGEPELAREADPLGPAVDHRLRTDVDAHPGHLGAAQLPAGPVGRLEHQHVGPGRPQVVGGDQPGDPGSHDDDAHGVSLSRGC